MRSTCSPKLLFLLALIPLLAILCQIPPAIAQDGAAAQPPAQGAGDATESHSPPVTAKINGLAHKVLGLGLKYNSLDAEGMQPWHLKVDFQMVQMGKPKPVTGTMEEWWLGRYRWKRAYSSDWPSWAGSEWSVSRFDRFRKKPGDGQFESALLNTRVTRPVIDPLYQAPNIKPDYEMSVKRVTTEGVALNCVSVVNGAQYVDDTNPDWLFPTMCFDNDMHLRLTTASDTAVQFDDVQMFQGRAVPRDVKVIVKGQLICEMKVSLLEPISADEALIKPPEKVTPEAFTLEPGMARPESVYEVGAAIPLPSGGMPYRGTIPVPILIRKDGSVKPNPEGVTPMPWLHELVDSLEVALAKWKFKPYLVDGQPVDVQITVNYGIDGKPFVPSYDRPKPKKVETAPEDFTSSYDPKRDPAKDLELAKAQAKQGNKRILLDVGGDWCYWCRVLDKFFDEHQDLKAMRDQNFVLMKVNMSSLNENYAFLSQYPKIPGYPWIFVLDADGKLVKSEDTDGLEDGAKGYSTKAIQAFLTTSKGQ